MNFPAEIHAPACIIALKYLHINKYKYYKWL